MLEFFTFLGVCLTLGGFLELSLLTFGALLPQGKEKAKGLMFKGKFVVIIPAHNEEKFLGRTLDALLKQASRKEILVVADNCSDCTEEVARNAGVNVIVRNDLEKIGKQYALRFAFDSLQQLSYDWLMVVDADTVVGKGCIEEVRNTFCRGVEAIQVRHCVWQPYTSLRRRWMHLAFLGFNDLRLRGRERLGLSCGILGNGFGMTKDLAERIPFDDQAIVEDLAFHLKLVELGCKVHFVETAAVYSEMPEGGKAVETQRTRWEGGRFALAFQKVPKLTSKVLKGDFRLLEPLIELLCLPMSYYTLINLLLLFSPYSWVNLYAGCALSLLIVHYPLAIFLGGGNFKDFVSLLTAPLYLAWKIPALINTLRFLQKGTSWKRTER